MVKEEVIPTCHSFCDGQLTLEAIGGVGDYSFEWNGKTGPLQSELCAGIYPVIIRDANNCMVTTEVEVRQPAAIGITDVKQTLPTCENGCDGALKVAASGGNGAYQYAWEGGGDTDFKNNICAGPHQVTITDQKGCTGTATLILDNPPPLPLDLGGGVTLCVGQTYALDAGTQWKGTSWKSSSGFTSTNSKVTITDPGAYWLEAVNEDGCVAKDTFLLETSFDLLKANFILSSEAYAEDTVVMIDVSWPLPESIEWSYPLGMKELQSEGDILYGQFSQPGQYQISMTAYLGECIDQLTKMITILQGDHEPEGGRLGYEDFVKEFTLYPNPNDGSFDVGVELAEESYIILSVWNTLTSTIVGKFTDQGGKSYVKHIDLKPLSSGAYVIRLDHLKGKEYIRFIVN